MITFITMFVCDVCMYCTNCIVHTKFMYLQKCTHCLHVYTNITVFVCTMYVKVFSAH